MVKVEALFTTPSDEKLFQEQIREEILPKLYLMPYIEKIELTSFTDTPTEIQKQFLDEPFYYQIAIYVKEEDIKRTFETPQGRKLILYLRSFGAQLTSAVGEVEVFYQFDL